jgi:ABC-2 type transport system ATP-binding protein
MPIIESVALRKVFRSIRRRPGLTGAIGALFSREYEEKVAVDGVSFTLEPGELVGYLGPNGAGKSTTIKMLTGILVPTSGKLEVAGLVPCANRQQNAQNIGVVFGQRSQLYWDLPLRESFELLRSIYDVPRDRYLQNLRHFTEILDLARFMGTPVRQLSLGERMRGDFAGAMLHDPQIVYLDEPTIGLDVVAKEAIRVFIEEVNRERGTTVILTTHDLADVERLTKRVVLIDDGTVIYDGALERLREEYGTHRTLVVTLAERCDDVAVAGALVESHEGNVVRYRFNRRDVSAELVIRRVTEICRISDVAIVEPDIDAIVRRIYVEGYTRGVPVTQA